MASEALLKMLVFMLSIEGVMQGVEQRSDKKRCKF